MKELLVIGITALIALSIFRFYENKRNANILNNSYYSIGTIISYRHFETSKFQSQSAKIVYTYKYDGKDYKDTYTNHIPSGIEIGSHYFIVVNEKYLTKTIIYLDYPIKDTTDFIRYVKEFEEIRKQKKVINR